MSSRSRRSGSALCCVLVMLVGCKSSDDSPSSSGGAGSSSVAGSSGAGAGGSGGTPAASPPDDPAYAGGMPPVKAPEPPPIEDAGGASDAQVVDAAPPAPSCAEGEMACDGDCIPVIEPVLEDLQKRIFSRSCGLAASCHMGVSPKEGLDLSSADATFGFVDEPSMQMPSAKLFDTDSPERSYLLRKLRGVEIADQASTGVASTQMPPPPTSPLCAAKIDAIEAWVKDGAKR